MSPCPPHRLLLCMNWGLMKENPENSAWSMLAMTSSSGGVSWGWVRVKNLSKFSAPLPHCRKKRGKERKFRCKVTSKCSSFGRGKKTLWKLFGKVKPKAQATPSSLPLAITIHIIAKKTKTLLHNVPGQCKQAESVLPTSLKCTLLPPPGIHTPDPLTPPRPCCCYMQK